MLLAGVRRRLAGQGGGGGGDRREWCRGSWLVPPVTVDPNEIRTPARWIELLLRTFPELGGEDPRRGLDGIDARRLGDPRGGRTGRRQGGRDRRLRPAALGRGGRVARVADPSPRLPPPDPGDAPARRRRAASARPSAWRLSGRLHPREAQAWRARRPQEQREGGGRGPRALVAEGGGARRRPGSDDRPRQWNPGAAEPGRPAELQDRGLLGNDVELGG